VLILITAAMVGTSTSTQKTPAGVDAALQIAKGFVTGDATYRFDGMAGTLKLDATGTFPEPGTYEVTCDFTSAHGGYGDRTGMFVTEALTPHRCILVVSGDRVTSALMDDTYDMIAQKIIQQEPLADLASRSTYGCQAGCVV
jgi:hypothetical protein